MENASLIETIRFAIDSRGTEVAALPIAVQYWMDFMRTLFLSSAIFVFWKTEARFVLAMAVSTGFLIILGKTLFPETHSGEIGAVVHLLLWTPTLIYLVTRRTRFMAEISTKEVFPAIYGVWSFVVMAVIAISLVLDVSSVVF